MKVYQRPKKIACAHALNVYKRCEIDVLEDVDYYADSLDAAINANDLSSIDRLYKLVNDLLDELDNHCLTALVRTA